MWHVGSWRSVTPGTNKVDQHRDLNILTNMQKTCSLVRILVLPVLLQNLIGSTEPFKNNSILLLLLFSSLSILMMIVTVVVVINLCSLTLP